MLRTCSSVALSAIASASALAGIPIGFLADIEPTNNTAADATPVPFPNIGGANCTVSVSGILNLSSGADVDYFDLSLAANDRLVVVTTPISGLPQDFSRGDTVVRIENAAGMTQVSDDDAGSCYAPGLTNSCYGSVVRFVAPAAGLYRIRVVPFNNLSASTGTYHMMICKHVPGCVTWTGSSNNTPANAEILGLRQLSPIAAFCLSSQNDDDYFAVDMAVGDVLVASTIPSPDPATGWNTPDTTITLLEGNGVTVIGTSGNDGAGQLPASGNVGSTIRFRAPASGRYFLNVTSSQATVEDYTLFAAVIPAEECQGDSNGDGFVNFADITNVLNNWNAMCN